MLRRTWAVLLLVVLLSPAPLAMAHVRSPEPPDPMPWGEPILVPVRITNIQPWNLASRDLRDIGDGIDLQNTNREIKLKFDITYVDHVHDLRPFITERTFWLHTETIDPKAIGGPYMTTAPEPARHDPPLIGFEGPVILGRGPSTGSGPYGPTPPRDWGRLFQHQECAERSRIFMTIWPSEVDMSAAEQSVAGIIGNVVAEAGPVAAVAAVGADIVINVYGGDDEFEPVKFEIPRGRSVDVNVGLAPDKGVKMTFEAPAIPYAAMEGPCFPPELQDEWPPVTDPTRQTGCAPSDVRPAGDFGYACVRAPGDARASSLYGRLDRAVAEAARISPDPGNPEGWTSADAQLRRDAWAAYAVAVGADLAASEIAEHRADSPSAFWFREGVAQAPRDAAGALAAFRRSYASALRAPAGDGGVVPTGLLLVPSTATLRPGGAARVSVLPYGIGDDAVAWGETSGGARIEATRIHPNATVFELPVDASTGDVTVKVRSSAGNAEARLAVRVDPSSAPVVALDATSGLAARLGSLLSTNYNAAFDRGTLPAAFRGVVPTRVLAEVRTTGGVAAVMLHFDGDGRFVEAKAASPSDRAPVVIRGRDTTLEAIVASSQPGVAFQEAVNAGTLQISGRGANALSAALVVGLVRIRDRFVPDRWDVRVHDPERIIRYGDMDGTLARSLLGYRTVQLTAADGRPGLMLVLDAAGNTVGTTTPAAQRLGKATFPGSPFALGPNAGVLAWGVKS